MKIFSLFLSKGIAFVLFVLFYFLLSVGGQTGAVQIASLLFCMATLYATIMRIVSEPKNIYRIWLLKQIVYLGFFGLAAYYDSLVFVAFAFIIYNGIITILGFIQKLRGINFVIEAIPQISNGLVNFLEGQNNKIADHQQQVLQTINNLFIRNSLIMTLIYIIILPFSRAQGYSGLYVFLAFIVFPLIAWRLNLRMLSSLFTTFISSTGQSWEEAFKSNMSGSDEFNIVDLNIKIGGDDEDSFIKVDSVIIKRLEKSKEKLTKTLENAKAKRDHYKTELDTAKQSNNEQAIKLAQELYDQAQDSVTKIQKRLDEIDIKIAKVKDGSKLTEQELEQTIESGLKSFFTELAKNNPKFKEMFGDEMDKWNDDDDDDDDQDDKKADPKSANTSDRKADNTSSNSSSNSSTTNGQNKSEDNILDIDPDQDQDQSSDPKPK